MALYRTKVKYIEAVKFTRNNIEEVEEFTNGKATNFIIDKSINGQASCKIKLYNNKILNVGEGKYIVKNSDDDFYICSEDSFESLYKYERCYI